MNRPPKPAEAELKLVIIETKNHSVAELNDRLKEGFQIRDAAAFPGFTVFYMERRKQ